MRLNLIHLQGSEHYHDDQETETRKPGANNVCQFHAFAGENEYEVDCYILPHDNNS